MTENKAKNTPYSPGRPGYHTLTTIGTISPCLFFFIMTVWVVGCWYVLAIPGSPRISPSTLTMTTTALPILFSRKATHLHAVLDITLVN